MWCCFGHSKRVDDGLRCWNCNSDTCNCRCVADWVLPSNILYEYGRDVT